MTRGFRKVGLMEQLGYRRRAPAYPIKLLTEEEIQQRREDNDRFCERMLREMGANKGLSLVKNREARIAVEGDTDLNHDNVEAAE